MPSSSRAHFLTSTIQLDTVADRATFVRPPLAAASSVACSAASTFSFSSDSLRWRRAVSICASSTWYMST